MLTMLLLLIAADEPKLFNFVEKPAPAKVVEARIDPRDKAIEDLKAQLVKADAAFEDVEDELATAKKSKAALQQAYDKLITELNNVNKAPLMASMENATPDTAPPLDFSGFAAQEQTPNVFIRVTYSDNCPPCVALDNVLRTRLTKKNKWFHDGEPNAQFQHIKISDAEWSRRGIKLPLVELIERGRTTPISEQDPDKLAAIWSEAYKRDQLLPQTTNSQQVAGIGVATISAKQQVSQLLAMLEPFLDGGTLQLIYTAKPGVVKEYLTIKQGAVGIRIPAKSSFLLSMKGGDLTITVQEPKLRVIVGPLERGIQEVDITPNKISLRLPWMVDPEINLK